MADVFTKAKRSEVVARIRRHGSEFAEIELVAGDSEVFDDIRDDAARDVARMPSEGDQSVGMEGIGVVSVAASRAEQFTTDFPGSPLQLSAVPRGVFAHDSGGEDKFIAEGGGNGTSGFEQCFEMGLGGQLKAERGFVPVAPVRVTAGQQIGFGDPHAVIVLPESHFRERNDHGAVTIARRASGVKWRFDGRRFHQTEAVGGETRMARMIANSIRDHWRN